jgi:alkylhydroperoxidase/carboxymuconolactone decarboxylase family protein YurZ
MTLAAGSKLGHYEILTHLAFYSGWPTSVSAPRIARDVFKQGG